MFHVKHLRLHQKPKPDVRIGGSVKNAAVIDCHRLSCERSVASHALN